MGKLEIMLVNTKVPRDTKAMVAKVRAQYNAQPKIVRPIMEAIDGISKSFLALLDRQLAQEKEEQEEEEGEEEMPSLQTKMEELISVNQSLLEALGFDVSMTRIGGPGYSVKFES